MIMLMKKLLLGYPNVISFDLPCRVKTAIVKKEEAVNSFRKQYEVRFCKPCQFL